MSRKKLTPEQQEQANKAQAVDAEVRASVHPDLHSCPPDTDPAEWFARGLARCIANYLEAVKREGREPDPDAIAEAIAAAFKGKPSP